MDAAHDVMRERGIRAVTTNAIAERANIKIGSLYDYFSNKEAVIAELYEGKLAEVRDFLDAEVIGIDRAAWRQQTANLIRNMWTYQLNIGLDRTLVDASYYYEDLLRIARAHSQLFASTFARLLKRLGSNWRDDQLLDLGISILASSREGHRTQETCDEFRVKLDAASLNSIPASPPGHARRARANEAGTIGAARVAVWDPMWGPAPARSVMSLASLE
jgi:AcrR family transcriptional regulator